MSRYLAGVDVGTSGARCSVFDLRGKRVASAGCEYGANYPQPGWVEQDADLLVARTMDACRAALAPSQIDASEIAAIGFSAQRSVTCAIDEQGACVRPRRWAAPCWEAWERAFFLPSRRQSTPWFTPRS